MATSTTNPTCILQKIIQPHWKQQHRIERVVENKIGRGRRWLLKIRHLEVGATHWHSMTKIKIPYTPLPLKKKSKFKDPIKTILKFNVLLKTQNRIQNHN